MTDDNTTPNPSTPQPLNPVSWWRTLCWINDQIAVSGDLDGSSHRTALRQLKGWLDAGITDIVDARGEWSDERLVAEIAPHVRYHWLGTHDNGGRQADEWFEAGLAAAAAVLADPDRKVVIHCHMGVNRGPSLAYAVLLSMGLDTVAALETIRRARPIAGIIYAEDAVDWWHRRIGTPETLRYRERMRARTWLDEHDNDVAWIVSRLHLAG